MLNENRAWVMSILKDSESSKKIDCVIKTVETASRLIVQAINNLDLSVFRAASGKAVPLSVFLLTSQIIGVISCQVIVSGVNTTILLIQISGLRRKRRNV